MSKKDLKRWDRALSQPGSARNCEPGLKQKKTLRYTEVKQGDGMNYTRGGEKEGVTEGPGRWTPVVPTMEKTQCLTTLPMN